MKRLFLLILLFSLTNACSLFVNQENAISESESENIKTSEGRKYNYSSDMWVSAYLGAWNHYAPPGGNWGNLPTEEIDWEAFTHLFYFSLTANEDGSLSEIKKYNTFSPSRLNAIVSAAHENNTAVLFSVGGWGNYPGFRNAIMPENRSNFVSNLVSTMEKWGFDGIDVDMEPIKDDVDVQNYKAFINELHKELQDKTTPLGIQPILTAATDWKPEMFAELSDKFDQINLMTYDMSGPWGGWVSWHNAPVYDGGYLFESSGRPVPSADGEIKKFMAAGVPKEKLGIGIDFYGYVWSGGTGTITGGVTAPRQSWVIAPSVKPNVPYYQIMKEYYKPEYHKWDDQAHADYLSIDNPLLEEDKFISFDHEQTIRSKIQYVREKGIGGTIIWELTGGYRKELPAGDRDKLLQTVKKEVWNK